MKFLNHPKIKWPPEYSSASFGPGTRFLPDDGQTGEIQNSSLSGTTIELKICWENCNYSQDLELLDPDPDFSEQIWGIVRTYHGRPLKELGEAEADEE